jgi:hypothetical protein
MRWANWGSREWKHTPIWRRGLNGAGVSVGRDVSKPVSHSEHGRILEGWVTEYIIVREEWSTVKECEGNATRRVVAKSDRFWETRTPRSGRLTEFNVLVALECSDDSVCRDEAGKMESRRRRQRVEVKNVHLV